MMNPLSQPVGVGIPDEFALSVAAYWRHLDANRLREPIQRLLKGIDSNDIEDLASKAQEVRLLISGAPLPEDI